MDAEAIARDLRREFVETSVSIENIIMSVPCTDDFLGLIKKQSHPVMPVNL